MARNALDLVESLASKGAAVSMENPESSYLWSYLDFAADLPFEDVLFTPCLFGAEYQKPTRLRCWNWFPSSLANKRCTLVNGTFTCGRSREQGHRVLEFGGGSTKDAAAYVPGLLKAWAHDVREHFLTNPDRMDALAAVRRVSSGPVARHVFRGPTDESQHEHRAAEDAQCTAGCRNPSDLRDGWPELWDTMSVVRGVLDQAREFSTDLRDLAGCCGSDPRRAPPLEATIRAVRRGLERTLAVPEGTFEGHHHASPWRTDLVGTILYRANDPDVAIWSWLRDGAPMGLSQPIVPGTHFPRVDIDAEAKLADLDSRAPWCQNHPSFDLQHGSTRSPAWDLLEEQVNEGFAWLFETRSAAEAFLDGPCHPAPLGNVSKTKEDGSVKHRLIQDLRANGVNTVVALPERQVLPRGIDHGADLACLGQCGVDDADDVDVFTLVLDFKNAFMSVPLHNDERRFNCANAGFTIRRAREPAYADEPDTGAFVVWASLGFGGRPNPLVFSRIASFAARTAQALLSPACRLQLYVDDPVISVRGSWAEASRELDLAIQWWLALGVPLAWAKGVVSTGTDPHRWIGVMYHLTPGGAVMRLPPDYVASLLAQLEPACSQRGKLSVHEVEVLCGKAGRVAHVVLSAHPFVSGLWGGLAAARALAKTKGDRFCFVPCRRLCFAASWLRALLLEAEDCPLRLERLVRPLRSLSPQASDGSSIEFDASIFGGGAILRDPGGHIVEYFAVVWYGEEAVHLSVTPTDSKPQSCWEFATLRLALCVWGTVLPSRLSLCWATTSERCRTRFPFEAKAPIEAVARELSWRQARRGWRFEVGHLSSEHNTVADALSRTADPKGAAWPALALASATSKRPPFLGDLWLAAPR